MDWSGPVPSLDVTATGTGAGDAPSLASRSQSVQFAFPMGLVRDKFTVDVAGRALLCRLAGGEDRLFLRSVPQVVFYGALSHVLLLSHLDLISRSWAAVSSSESAVVLALLEPHHSGHQ